MAVISLFVFIVFLSFESKRFFFTRFGILIATLIGCFNNVFEFFYPETFFPIDSEHKVLGRSAGFFVNANIAGTALNLGLILSIEIIQKRFRSIYSFIVFIGILFTFSRSGMAGWFLLMVIFSFKNVLDVKKIVFLSGALLVFIYLGLPKINNFLNDNMSGAVSNITNRLLWFSNPEIHRDSSQIERELVAGRAWNAFLEKPYFGNGIGYTSNWDLRTGPHNIYLVTLAEYGLIGILIYPALIYLSILRLENLKNYINVSFFVLTLFVGIFSHNLLTDTFLFYTCAIISIINFNKNEYE
ncbi:O-antigen ligase family protein [Lutimonas zeaxanthinifaciens]|uniref:O-antigen ligase family protein n=1 Tax=Lutimonas zeaxanthinifaciens TaxID=3060215 RepID=UPI00265CD7EA|nr:O-antigen ligase family protein [Lutimonas sp. YSD2104]WKK66834.1 O-antigen ligase family protein [Lutimonas sp. YSD2104]